MLSKLVNQLTFLWIPLTFLLTTCAPLPKEGQSSNQAEVTLTLQHRSAERTQRGGSSSRATEFIVVVAAGTIFSEAGPTSPLNSGVLNLSSAQVTLSLNLDIPLRLFIYRYATILTTDQLLAKLANQTLNEGAIDYGVTNDFTVASGSTTTQLSLSVQLQRETTFLDSAVQGLSYSAGGRAATTNQDGLIYYFPDETIALKLSDIPLGSFKNPPSTLTPYSVMGLAEGTSADNVTNLVRLLLSLDSDSDAENGIQLNTNQFGSLSRLRSLADFSVDNLSFASDKVPGLTLPSVQKAQKHLSRTMRQKNLADNNSNSGLSSPLPIPLSGEQGFPLNGRIGLAFAENLRSSSISPSSLVLTDTHNSTVKGTVSVKRNWLLFKPTSNLNQKTTYQATASAGLVSQSGQKLLDNYTWSFTTGDNSSSKFPKVIQKEPRDNATGVARNAIPTLTFNGPLFEGTNLSFALSYSGNQSLISCSPSLWAASVHCLPNSLLDNNTSYTATLLKDSLQSLENIGSDNISWSFTTGNSTTSNSASLQHIGEFNDNYTRDRVILLQVGQGASQYRLSDNLSTPAETEWQLPLFYPVRAPFVLSGAQGNQRVRVFYRADNQTPIDNQSLTLTYDYSLPVSGLSLPEATNQEALPYLILAKDNLSGVWRHLITRGNTYPNADLEQWKVFPSTPIDNTTRRNLWDNITRGNLSFNCVDKSTLQAFAAGNSTVLDNSSLNTTNCATFNDFNQLLPSWNNQSFRFENLSQNTEENHTLWVQDRAGNIGWGFPFRIRFDNATPDTSKTTVELDNLSSSFNGLNLKLNTTDNDTHFFLAQFDNSTTPNAYGSGWVRAQPNLLYSLLLDNTSSVQQHSFHLWLRDKAGNIDNLTPRTAYRAWLYDGQIRVDNQSNPTVNAYAGLKLKYPLVLPSSYPLANLQLQKVSDNLSVSGQWNLDNDSLIFWSTGPLLRETNYQLKLKGFVDPNNNLRVYPSQLFHFKTDNQTLNLNNGLVAYYPLDNNTLDKSGNGLHGINTNADNAADRFGKLGQAYSFNTNEYVSVPHSTSLNLSGNFTLSAWIFPTNPTGAELQGIISKYNSNGANTYTFRLWNGNLNLAGANSPSCSAPITANQWSQVSAIIHTSDFADLYLNSSKVCTVTNMRIATKNDPLKIGNDYDDSRGFLGKIDEVRIYNRALNFDEIKALHAIADPNPPKLISSEPAHNSTKVGVTDNITVFFDKPLKKKTIQVSNIELRRSDNVTVAGSVYSVSTDNKSLIFDPSNNLSSLTNYTLYLHSGITDYLDNSISPAQITFQTKLFGGGTGLDNDPYQVNDIAGLLAINDNLSANYILMDNITLISNWVPLGGYSNRPFTGKFDGAGYHINNLNIDRFPSDYTGLFAYGQSGVVRNLTINIQQINANGFAGALFGRTSDNVSIKNVTINYAQGIAVDQYHYAGGLIGYQESNSGREAKLTNVRINGGTLLGAVGYNYYGGIIGRSNHVIIDNVSSGLQIGVSSLNRGKHYLGGLIGQAYSTQIKQSSVSGDVFGTGYRIGGLIGHAYLSSVHHSSASGNVSSTWRDTSNDAGGLIGYSQDTDTYFSHASGNVIGGFKNIGGLIGSFGSNSVIEDSYATGNVSQLDTQATYYLGGLVGYQNSSSIVRRSYATGNVVGYRELGGLIGRSESRNAGVFNNYATGNVSGNLYAGALIGYTTGRPQIKFNYAVGQVTAPIDIRNNGGLIGDPHDTSSLISSYFDHERAETATQRSDKGTPRSTAQLQQASSDTTIHLQPNYVSLNDGSGWDNASIWDFGSACDEPRLARQPAPSFKGCAFTGDGHISSQNVSPLTDLRVSFNRNLAGSLDNLTSHITISDRVSNNLNGSWTSLDNRTLVFQPMPRLLDNETYTISVLNGITTADGSSAGAFIFSFQTSSLTEDLSAWYRLDEYPAIDSISGKRSLLFNQTKLTFNRYGLANRAYTFDGSGDYVRGVANTQLPIGNDARTLCAWIRSEDDSGQPVRTGYPSTGQGFGFLENNHEWYYWRFADDISSGINDTSANWNHHCLSHDNATSISRYYFNGKMVKSTQKTLHTSSVDNLTLGYSHSGTDFKGQIDDVRMYKRVLSWGEIQALMNQESPKVIASSPQSGATGVSRDSTITLSFDQALQGIDSTTVSLVRLHDNASTSGDIVLDNDTITFTLRDNLSKAEAYELRVSTKVTNDNGTPLKEPATLYFITAP